MLEWDDLRYFLAFARAGSMQAAAKVLGVNQSTVQRRLAELEERLGRQLVERHLGGYRLSELGGELRPAAEAVEAAVAAFECRLAACDKGLTGTIRVTCGTILANRLQRTPLIAFFHRRNPGLRVELIISDREFELPKEADIAIRGGEPQDEALVGRKIAEASWAVYASRDYVKRHGRPENPADIERHLVVDCVFKHPGAQWLRSVAPRATIASRADNHPGLILAVRSGAGLAALLTFQGDGESELVRVIDRINLVTPYYLLMHRDMQNTPRVRAFADSWRRKSSPFERWSRRQPLCRVTFGLQPWDPSRLRRDGAAPLRDEIAELR
jgi:DNA-binding transcriptional LysR family regulator